MRPDRGHPAGHLFVALLLVAGRATAQSVNPCPDWQAKFYGIHAAWRESATSRLDLERVFGAPSRLESSGPCTLLHYAAADCSCSFAVCSEGRVVSKTMTVGASALPALITTDPAALADSIQSLQAALRDAQEQIRKLHKVIETLAPAPSPLAGIHPPAAVSAAPEARKAPPRAAKAAPRCAALTLKGARCSRTAAAGSTYCWQHRR